MKIGILSSGGDCPGINATIRAVGKSAISHFGFEMLGIRSGFLGLINKEVVNLDNESLSNILTIGGTILGTSREKPFKKGKDTETVGLEDKPKIIKENYKDLGLDCLVCIGGNGTQKTAYKLSELGLNVIGIPKTIDNDLWGTEVTFGFDTAVNIATEAIDRLHSTASSHKRVMVIELMGHNAGWITLYAGMAGGADVILIPEIEFDIDKVCKTITERSLRPNPYSIVAIGEGVTVEGKSKRPAANLSRIIEKNTGVETRETVLGYVQRGGSPSPYDRNLATRLGAYATELIAKGDFGKMVCIKGTGVSSIPLEKVSGRLKLVPKDHELILQGQRMGICFGI